METRAKVDHYAFEGALYVVQQIDLHTWHVFDGAANLGQVTEQLLDGDRPRIEYRAVPTMHRSRIGQVTTDVWGTAIEFLISPY